MVTVPAPTLPAEPLVGASHAFRLVLEEARLAALSDRPVLLIGESGSGKGRIAREIHDRSDRRDKPYVVWSAPAGSETLGRRDLFGHVKGAFTGADQDGPGLIQAAHAGTLLIDDIDKL